MQSAYGTAHPRLHFYSTATISNKQHKSKVEVGIIEGQYTAMKVIECTEEQEILYRQIIAKRHATSLYVKPQSCFDLRKTVSTIVDRTTDQERRFLLIFAPYVAKTELTNYTNTALTYQTQRITPQQQAIRIVQVIIKAILILMTSSNHQIYTYDSFLFEEDDLELTINKASFVGMSLLLNDQLIDINSFKEILCVLESDTLDKPPQQRFNLQLKFRGLANLLISLIIQQKFTLFYGHEIWTKLQDEPSLQAYRQMLRELNVKYQNFLNNASIKTKLQRIDKLLNIRISKFLRRLLVSEQKMGWGDVFDLLVPKRSRRGDFSQKARVTPKIAQQMYSLLPLAAKCNIILNELGICDPKIYLTVLLYSQDTPIELLMTQFDMDHYFFSPRNFNPENMAIYKRLIRIVSILLSQAGFQFFHFNSRLINKPIQAQIGQIEEYNRKRSSSNKYNKLQKSHLLEFLIALTNNFAVYRSQDKDRKYIVNTQEAKSIKIYTKMFS